MDTLSTAHREPGWESRLHDMTAQELLKPFDWVMASCIDLMAISVLACRGPKHPALLAIPEYKTESEAKSALSRRGGLLKVVARYFNEVPVLHAMQGDIALLKSPDDEKVVAGGIVLDGNIVGRREGAARVYRLPLTLAYKVYRV